VRPASTASEPAKINPAIRILALHLEAARIRSRILAIFGPGRLHSLALLNNE
jgi:hypothetical protein